MALAPAKAVLLSAMIVATSFAVLDVSYDTSTNEDRHTQHEYELFMPEEVVVGFHDDVSSGDISTLIRSHGGSIIGLSAAHNEVLVEVDGDPGAFIDEMMLESSVRYAERNGVVRALYTPNDPDYDNQWGPGAIGCPEAWDIEKGDTGILVAVLDTGIDYFHEDLTNYVPGGYDWVYDDTDPWDDGGHGTHCAGIIAATMDNQLGISGIAQVGIMAEKVLNSAGSGSDWGTAQGIIHATDAGADVISLSLATPLSSSVLKDACQYAWDAGVVLVAAAGNNNGGPVGYPAAYGTVIAVSALSSSTALASYSNIGPEIELAAPGSSIYSTVPGNGYSSKSGTSMAAPHVAGVAALILSHDPTMSNSELRELLNTTADDLGAPGRDDSFGHGRVDAYECLLSEFPDIWVYPSSMDIRVAPGSESDVVLTIGNNGDTVLDCTISTEEEGTGDYAMDTGVSYSWIDATGGSDTGLSKDDETVTGVPLGFDFFFYDKSFDKVNVCSNGWLSFEHTGNERSDRDFPSTNYNYFVAPLWDDWYLPGSGEVYYRTFGTSPNRYFVVEWHDIEHYDDFWGDDHSTFEAIIYENGDLKFSYDHVGYTNGVTVGLNRGDGSKYNMLNGLPSSGSSILFSGSEGWLSLSPDTGSTPVGEQTDFTVTIDTGNLDAGEYYGSIIIQSNDPDEDPTTVDVHLTVSGNDLPSPPVADTGGPYTVDEGTHVTFDATGSSDPDGDTLSYRWDYDNDGAWDTVWSTDPIASHVWEDDYSGTAVVEVSDGQFIGTDMAIVEVNNAPPVVNAGSNLSVFKGDTVSLAPAAFTDPGSYDTHTAQIDWGDGTVEPGTVDESGGVGTVTGSHAYSANGVYTVTIFVTDNQGAEGSGSFTVGIIIIVDTNGGGDFTRIQDAINAASPGATIHVWAGMYSENLVVDKSINLVGGLNGGETTIAGDGLGDVIRIEANLVTISGFSVNGGVDSITAGLRIESDHNRIFDNDFSMNRYGIYLFMSDYNEISDNSCTNNIYGISLYRSSSNEVRNNTCESNDRYGIYVYRSSSNEVRNNTCESNDRYGIYVYRSSSINITNNSCTSNHYGISLYRSFDCTVIDNCISSNQKYGVYLRSSGTISVYHNSFIDNSHHAYDNGVNAWDNGYLCGGNYWDDYTGLDVYQGQNQDVPGSDGKGDSTYTAARAIRDNYPLMNPSS